MEEFFEEEYNAEVLVNQTEQKMLYKMLVMIQEEKDVKGTLDSLEDKIRLLVE